MGTTICKRGLHHANKDCDMQMSQRTNCAKGGGMICKWYANAQIYIYIYHLLTKGRRGLCKWEVCKRARDWIMTFWDSEVHFWGWKCQFWVWKSHFWVWKCHFGFHLFGAESAIFCINFGVSIWGFLVPHFGAENTIFEGLKSHFVAKDAPFFFWIRDPIFGAENPNVGIWGPHFRAKNVLFFYSGTPFWG